MSFSKLLCFVLLSSPLFGWVLNHRLTPTAGNVKIVTAGINLTNRLHPAPKAVGGISLFLLADYANYPFHNTTGVYRLTTSQEDIIKDLKLPMSRAYSLATGQPGTLHEMIDKAAYFFTRMNIPLSNAVLCFEHYGGNSNYFLSETVYTNAIKYSHNKGYGFRRWEISNEPQWHNLNSKSYLAHIKKIGAAIRKVAPNDLIGMHGYWSTEWGEKLLTNAVGFYDFSIMHNYSFKNAYSTNFENIVITDNACSLGIIAKYNKIMKSVNPNAVQYDTEWGLHMGTNMYTGADYNITNGNIIGTMHRAVRLIYYLRENLVEGAGGWNLLGRNAPGFMAIRTTDLAAWNDRSLLYWLYYYLNRTVGDYALDIYGSSPYHTAKSGELGVLYSAPSVPFVAMINKENTELSIIAANGNWNADVPFTINVTDGEMAEVISSVVLSHNNMSVAGYPFANSQVVTSNFTVTLTQDKLTTTLPKHSVFFFRATLKKIPGIASGASNIKPDSEPKGRLGRVTYSTPTRAVSVAEGHFAISNLPVNSKIKICSAVTGKFVSTPVHLLNEEVGEAVWNFAGEDGLNTLPATGVYLIQIECGEEKLQRMVVLY